MRISSGQIRQRAIEAYEAGLGTQAEVAKLYGVDVSTFERWMQRYRQTGRAAPLPRGHNPAALDNSRMLQLDALVEQTPDATLEQLRSALGVDCSIVAIHNALKRLGYGYKKNSARQRTRSPRRQRSS